MTVSACDRPPSASGDRRAVVVLVVGFLAAGLGFYAVMAHVVAHLRDDAGLAAGTIALVLGVRVGVQYALYLPAGPVVDRVGAARAGIIACLLRTAGFAALGVAGGLPGLFVAAVLLGTGGALLQPATRSLMAGLRTRHRSHVFGAYIVAGQVAAVAGPPVGLMLLADDVLGVLAGGFGLLCGAAAAAWAASAATFALLPRPARTPADGAAGTRPAGVWRSCRAVLRDRAYLRFTLLAAPTTLLPTEAMAVVPLKGFEAGVTTLYFCVSAAVSAAVQPWCAATGRRGVVRAGRGWALPVSLASSGAGYLLLIPLEERGAASLGALMGVAVLHGFANGLLEPAVFQNVTRHAPLSQVGAYYGVMAFVSGVVAFVGGLVVGRLFDAGPAGAAAALAGLGVLALATAAWPAAERVTCRVTGRVTGRITGRPTGHAAARRNAAAMGAAASAPVPPSSTITAKARSPR
ncbi:hypothetical protein Arub01_02710 [Actinomadura rubrobrunea]|uniref:Major facilitator superfamily (MFS) profile domain-containing protein n=1 Tax=Actinomadura rubrobrunea TaxID=115335 RepID=A0A9W6UU95_9ACTN|nr:MFS transporter [Actinomadura rubrobrunea]GLW62027.1 hypothetical protein Arub01_02710 [Actinomadura rubrobrunea]